MARMDWQRQPSKDIDDPTGVAAVLRRAQSALGGAPIRGARFLHNSEQMLRSTREIEAAVSGRDTTLYVGFQNDRQFAEEADVYTDLTKSGVKVYAFGEGRPAQATDMSNLVWTSLVTRPHALENQWYLVTKVPESLAFVGYEVSPERVRGTGPAGAAGKAWEGFVSNDERIIDLIIRHLENVVRLNRDN